MNADHDNIVTVAVSPQRVAVERLTDIAISFMNRDQIVIFCAEGIIVQMIGIIDEKEILPVERFADMLPLKNDDHNLILGIPLPLGHLVRLSVQGKVPELPVQPGPVVRQGADC